MKFLFFIFLTLSNIFTEGIHIKSNNYKYNDNGRVVTPNQEELALLPKDGGNLWNRLVFSNSPYLLQHASNPVDWYPWSKEAFIAAKEQNKPIFLSIGYTTCHWCHVMEHESFENPDIAKLMNETFINVKVDREERPDIDNIYMEVTQMLTGRGGWPMKIIMTPDKKPFFAGTYFPKNSIGNRSGMNQIIPEISKLWNEKQDSIINSANQITQQLINRDISRNSKVNIAFDKILNSAFKILNENFDSEYGGFKGSRNKFPKPHDYSFLVRYYSKTGDKNALSIVNKSLYEMKKGGVYDQIGYGFHRYSTDKKWLVPHFEKMLYDQAMIIHAYLDAYIITNDIFYKETIQEICDYVIRDMTSPNGGFYSAEDADSRGEEGTFYIWDYEEFYEILDDNSDMIIDMLNIRKQGNAYVEGQPTNIPHFTENWEQLSKKYNYDIDELKNIYNVQRNNIFNYRKLRVHPQKDDKILTDWNGLMISALSRAGIIFDTQLYIDVAEHSANFILSNLISNDGGLNKSFRFSNSNIPGMIEDYSFFIWGLIELYQSTGNEKYLINAQKLMDYQIDNFWDSESFGFYFTSKKAEELIIRNKEAYDGAIPSGNSVSAYNLIRLARILSRNDYEELAFKTIEAFSYSLKRYSAGYTVMLQAIDYMMGPSYEVIIVGNDIKETNLINKLHLSNQFNKVVIFKDLNKKLIPELSFLENYTSDDNNKMQIYVCKNYVCNLPTSNLDEVLLQLNK